MGRRARNAEAPLQQLNQRELQVLSLMAEGRSNAAIAEEAYLSESTISKHIKSIFSKLRLSEETLTHRRVAAVLTYLSDHSR